MSKICPFQLISKPCLFSVVTVVCSWLVQFECLICIQRIEPFFSAVSLTNLQIYGSSESAIFWLWRAHNLFLHMGPSHLVLFHNFIKVLLQICRIFEEFFASLNSAGFLLHACEKGQDSPLVFKPLTNYILLQKLALFKVPWR